MPEMAATELRVCWGSPHRLSTSILSAWFFPVFPLPNHYPIPVVLLQGPLLAGPHSIGAGVPSAINISHPLFTVWCSCIHRSHRSPQKSYQKPEQVLHCLLGPRDKTQPLSYSWL